MKTNIYLEAENTASYKWISDELVNKKTELVKWIDKADIIFFIIELHSDFWIKKIEEIRKENEQIIIICLININKLSTDISAVKIAMFKAGADNCFHSPYDFKHISMFVQRFQRFNKKSLNICENIEYNGFVLEMRQRDNVGRTRYCGYLFTPDKKEIYLQEYHHKILWYLFKHADKNVLRKDLLLFMYGEYNAFLGASLRVIICGLRKKLADSSLEIGSNRMHEIIYLKQKTDQLSL